jgi:hypothetical protein
LKQAVNFGNQPLLDTLYDEDQSNTKRNHVTDPLEVPIGPITRARAKKLKEALNELVQKFGARWT